MHRSCVDTTSYLTDSSSCTRTHTHSLMHNFRPEWTKSPQMSVYILYIMQNTKLFTSRRCLLFSLSLLSFSYLLPVCLWRRRTEVIPPLLPNSLPLCVSCSTAQKNGSQAKKKVTEKNWNEIQPHFNLISFLAVVLTLCEQVFLSVWWLGEIRLILTTLTT